MAKMKRQAVALLYDLSLCYTVREIFKEFPVVVGELNQTMLES